MRYKEIIMQDGYRHPDDAPLNLKALESLPVIGRMLKRGPKIPVVRLSGVIADSVGRRGGLSYNKVRSQLEKAFGMAKAPAVALVINSPGGSAAQSQLIGKLIRQLAAEKEKPVYAFVEDVAASGGYWLACAADEIYAQETSIVGSIGVISAGFGFEDFIDRHQIKRRLYTSGRDKSLLDPFLPEKPGDIARLTEAQREIHEHFIDWVKDRRGGKLNGTDEELFEGRFWVGSIALDMGAIDAVGDVRSVMREKYGEDINLVYMSPEKKKLPYVGSFIQDGWVDDILTTVEDRAIWSRFGL